jgi:hypothetical protein
MTYASACGNANAPSLASWRKPVAPQLQAVTVSLAQGAAMFAPFNALVKAGAKWGDIEVFELEEWNELVAIRLAASLYVPPEDFTTFETLIEYGEIVRAYVEDPEPEEPEPEPEPIVYSRPPCEVCGIFLSHSSPPPDFKGRNLCCLWCSIKNGAAHGERCQRCPLTLPKTSGECCY